MGVLRLFLAISVVNQHFQYPLGVKLLEQSLAVYLFFIISGFYVALILNEKYVGNGSIPVFYVNRALMLCPTYALAILLFVIVNFHAMPNLVARTIALPWPLAGFVAFSNLTGIEQELFRIFSFTPQGLVLAPEYIDPAHNGGTFMLNFPAWSLSVEIAFYAVAPFFVRSITGALALVVIGVVYGYVAPGLLPGHRLDLYFPFNGLLFGLGALGYWLWRSVTRRQHLKAAAIVGASAIALAGPVPSSLLCWIVALVIPVLFALTRRNSIDGFVGDLSYPVYMMQVPVMWTVYCLGYEGRSLAGMLAVLTVAALMVLLVERPIDRFRQAYAARARRTADRVQPTLGFIVAAGR